METVKTVKEFIRRIEEKKSVSRFEIGIHFKWDKKTSEALRDADLSWADLSWANLSWANLRGANLRGARRTAASARTCAG